MKDERPAGVPAVPAPLRICPRCTGGGQVSAAEHCPECLGQPYTNIDGIMLVCQACHGTGRRNLPCPECGGKGTVAAPPASG